jgi:hypothetical protein
MFHGGLVLDGDVWMLRQLRGRVARGSSQQGLPVASRLNPYPELPRNTFRAYIQGALGLRIENRLFAGTYLTLVSSARRAARRPARFDALRKARRPRAIVPSSFRP